MKHLKTTLLCILLLVSLVTLAHSEAIMMPDDQDHPHTYLPISKLKADININDQVVTAKIDQGFINITEFPIDGTYYYPVPEEATVTGFGRYINGWVQYFPLEPGEQGAPGNGGEGGGDMQEYLGPNPFAAPVPELNDGETRIRFEYTALLDYVFGSYSFSYPLQMSQFITGTIDTVDVTLTVHSQRAIQELMVSNYDVEVVYSTEDSAQVRYLAYDVNPQDPFNVELMVDQEDVGLWLLPHHSDTFNPGYFLAVLEPGVVADDEIIEKTFTFVFDRSGSMRGENRIDEAKEAAIYCIENLGENDYFNIIAFNSSVSSWRNDPVQATEANISSGVTFINGLTPSGGTNLEGAMMEAVSQEMSDEAANQILLLSDGVPTSGVTHIPTILSKIVEGNDHDASIFTVGVGASDSQLDFLSMIAYQNHGLSIYFPPGMPNLAEEIALFYTRFSSPVLINITFDWGSAEVEDIYPPAPYNIFAGGQSVLGGRYCEVTTSEITMNAQYVGQDTSIVYGPYDWPTVEEGNEFVPRMWAIRKIDYWLAYMAVYGEDQEIIDMIIELSLQFGILTPYTSYNTPVEDSPDLRVSAAVQPNGIQVVWTTSLIGQNVTYDVYRREFSGKAWLKLTALPVETTQYLDKTAEKGVSYVYRVEMHPEDGEMHAKEVTVSGLAKDPFSLDGIYPTPFNEQTRVSFSLAQEGRITLEVFDMLGRKVRTLWDRDTTAGKYSASLDGAGLASGTYFVRMSAADVSNGKNFTAMKKMVLVK